MRVIVLEVLRKMTQLRTYNVQIPDGCVSLLVGGVAAGKTRRIHEYLKIKNDLFEFGHEIHHVIFYYSVWQTEYTKMNDAGLVQEWVQGFPTNDEFRQKVSPHERSIVILDDAMSHISRELLEIVTVSARHCKATVFILFQSLFPVHPLARQISLNTRMYHLMKNPRDAQQIQVLARQIRPRDWRFVVESYQAATAEPYSCFIIDLLQETPDDLRFRSNILPNEWPLIVWTAKKKGRKGSTFVLKLRLAFSTIAT